MLPALLGQLPDAQVVPDEVSPWNGYRACLQDLPRAVSHVCVLQDDVKLAKNFPLAVERIAEANPDEIVALFIGGLPGPTRSGFHRAALKGERYCPVVRNRVVHVVALLWPRVMAEYLLAWVADEKNVIPGHNPPISDDAVIGWWAHRTNQPIIATIPCLVEHEDMVPSTVSTAHRFGRNRNRVAIRFIGDEDPLEIDWSRNVPALV